jgi:hypothetical protein
MAIQTIVDIDGTDVTSKVYNYEYERVFGETISQATINLLKSVNDVITLKEGQEVSIQRGYDTEISVASSSVTGVWEYPLAIADPFSKAAQNFAPSTDITLKRIKIRGIYFGDDCNIIAELRSVDGSHKPNAVLSTGTIASSSAPFPLYGEMEFTMTPVSLTAGTEYSLVVYIDNPTSTTNIIWTGGTKTYPYSDWQYYTPTPAWTTGTWTDLVMNFNIIGTPTTINYTQVFSGYIQSYEPEGGKVKVIAQDELWMAIRAEANLVYDSEIDAFGGNISAIFHDLITDKAGLSATLNPSTTPDPAYSIQNIGTTNILKKFICNHADVFERCKALADAIGWQFYYRSDTDLVYFEPKGFTANSNSLEVGGNIIKVPKWTYDATELVNDLTVIGANQEVGARKSGTIANTTDYPTPSVPMTKTGILLDYVPNAVTVYKNGSSTPSIGGVEDSSSYYDYSVDKTQKVLKPFTGSEFSAGDTYVIEYTLFAPTPVHLTNPISIATYSPPPQAPFMKTITYNDIQTVNDARVRGQKYLDQYSTPFIYTTLMVNVTQDLGLDAGQIVQVLDNVSQPAVNKNLIITRKRYRYPADYDELDVGDRIWRLAEWQTNVDINIKRLLERDTQNADYVIELIDIDNSVNTPIELKQRYLKVDKKTIMADSFIVSSKNYGILGTSKLGGGYNNQTQLRVLHPNNIYTETFIDADFKDATQTTATWSGGSLVF